jgi:hypothetical protein
MAATVQKSYCRMHCELPVPERLVLLSDACFLRSRLRMRRCPRKGCEQPIVKDGEPTHLGSCTAALTCLCRHCGELQQNDVCSVEAWSRPSR